LRTNVEVVSGVGSTLAAELGGATGDEIIHHTLLER
jgi:hypothetical protein